MKIFFDIETKNSFDDLEKRDPEGLMVSVVGVYKSDTCEYLTFEDGDLNKLQNLFINASAVIGFNIKSFDLPVLKKYLSINLDKLPVLDLFEEPKAALGYRPSLNGLASGTLGKRKSGDGLAAIELWKNGEIEKLHRYCLDDVQLTKELYEEGCLTGSVKFENRTGTLIKINVGWKSYNPIKGHNLQYCL